MDLNKNNFHAEREFELFILKSDGTQEETTIKIEEGKLIGTYNKTFLGLTDAIIHNGDYKDITFDKFIFKLYSIGHAKLKDQIKASGVCVCNPNPHDRPQSIDDPDLFIDWYSRTKLMPHIKKNSCIVFAFERNILNSLTSYNDVSNGLLSSEPICVYGATNYPEVNLSDLREYAHYIFQGPDSLPPLAKLILKVHSRLKRRRWCGTYTGDGNHIDDLYWKLIGRYIDCTLEEFRGIFGVDKYIRPVRWIGKQSELVYFMKELQNQGYLLKSKSQDWELVRVMFSDKSGKLFNDNFKSIWHNLEQKVSKKFQDFITELIKQLDDPFN